MAKKILINQKLVDIILSRLARQLIEVHGDFSNSVIIGLQKGGTYLADRIQQKLLEMTGEDVPVGYLDITFYRDDFRRRNEPLTPSKTSVPFLIENKRVILMDDVLYTGRSINSALIAMQAFGRPKNVELLVMIDRKYSRDLPIYADFVGQSINSIQSQKVIVGWKDIDEQEEDIIWLVNQ